MTGADLRASILQAAVQGKLVPQDKNDEPASVLLERIRAERAELVKQKKVRTPRGGESVITRYEDGTVWEQRGKNAAVEITDEVPFDIPDGWEWARMGSIASKLTDGSHNPPPKRSNGYKVISAVNIKNGHIDLELTQRFCDEAGFAKENPRTNIVRGDIILGIIGGSIGNLAIFDHDEQVIAQRSIAIIRTIGLDALVCVCLQAPYVMELLTHTKAGTAQGGVYLGSLADILVPVPPPEEQQRIAAKIDELMPLVERYGKLNRERTALNEAIAGDMRASILQAAVQGSMTEREPTDEPASVLLERIREERRELVKQKKARAPKGGDSVITRYEDGTVWEQRGKGAAVEITDEVPFDIPEGWEWTRLNQIGEIVGGGTPKTSESAFWASDNDPDGIPWITPADMRGMGGLMVSRGARNITKAGLEGSSAQLMPAGTVLMSSRAPIGYLGVAINPVSTNQGFKSVVCVDMDMNLWVVTAIDALMNGIKERASGTTFKEISGTEFGLTLIPIPPLAEQQRIVAKLDELLPKTEKLGKLVS